MKPLKLFAFFILFFGTVSYTVAQDSTLYKVKIERYKSMQRSGRGLLIAGGTTVAVGAITSGIGWGVVPQENSDDMAYTIGYIGVGVAVAGIFLMVPGIILNSVGKNKVREYQIRLNDLRPSFYYTPQHAGFTLTYRF
ncbi:MAG: hypothetical protein JW973_02295 [Bacteroidales bacterium]|nr:hypothetical protein [Bacteroidales bacterium]